MQSRLTWTMIILGVAVPAVVMTPLFTPADGTPEPTAAQLPLFITLSLLEALLFGAGVAFAVLGRNVMRAALPYSPKLRVLAHASLVFLIGSWWLHDNLHKVNGTDMTGLLLLEYGFHLPLMAGAVILVVAIGTAADSRRRPESS